MIILIATGMTCMIDRKTIAQAIQEYIESTTKYQNHTDRVWDKKNFGVINPSLKVFSLCPLLPRCYIL